MKLLTLLACLGSIAVTAAPPPPQLSARPIQNLSLARSDRAFMTDVAAGIIVQKKAFQIGAEFSQNQYFIESARFTLKTLEEIENDLKDIARARAVALPLEENVDPPRDFDRLMNARNGSLEREVDRYAQRNSRKLWQRFERAANHADDAEVRSFALRHVAWLAAAHRETKAIAVAVPNSSVPSARPRSLATGRAAEIFEPPTSVPLAAAGSPAAPGASQ